MATINARKHEVMSQTKSKSTFLTVRVTDSTRIKFHAKVARYGTPSAILRELVEAFNEGRIQIHPPVNRKESLYVPRNQN